MTAGEIPNVADMAVSAALNLPPSTLSIAAGYAAFASSMALSTFLQLKLLGVSTGSPRPIPSLLGIASVAFSSLASHKASIKVYSKQNDLSLATTTSSSRDMIHFGAIQVDKHTLRICVLGLLSFKLLGGRFWGVAPSSYTHLGSFARWSLPATKRYASSSQRVALEELGRWVGCHTCGSHMMLKSAPRFHGDHMPPLAVAQQMNQRLWRRILHHKVKFRFYPQCVDCSNVQGSILSMAVGNNSHHLAGAGGGKLAKFHGLRFRPFHLAGGVIAAVTVVDATDSDIAKGNRRRYRKMQNQLESMSRDAYTFCRNLIP